MKEERERGNEGERGQERSRSRRWRGSRTE